MKKAEIINLKDLKSTIDENYKSMNSFSSSFGIKANEALTEKFNTVIKAITEYNEGEPKVFRKDVAFSVALGAIIEVAETKEESAFLLIAATEQIKLLTIQLDPILEMILG